MLEVVGVTGVVHLGQIQSGIRSAVRLAQGGHVRFNTRWRNDSKRNMFSKIDSYSNEQRLSSTSTSRWRTMASTTLRYNYNSIGVESKRKHLKREKTLKTSENIIIFIEYFQATMLRKRKNKIKRRNTEPSVSFPDVDDDSKC